MAFNGKPSTDDLMQGNSTFGKKQDSQQVKSHLEIAPPQSFSEGLVAEEADLTGFDPNMTISECCQLVAKIALPPIMGNMIQLLVQMITVFFIGRMNDPVLLAAVGLGNMMINVLAFAITQGLNGALEYYVSNAFGQRQYKECGQWLNRGKLVATLALIPVLVMFVNSEAILLKLGQDPDISRVSSIYVCMVIPGVWSQIMFDATKKFHSAQLI